VVDRKIFGVEIVLYISYFMWEGSIHAFEIFAYTSSKPPTTVSFSLSRFKAVDLIIGNSFSGAAPSLVAASPLAWLIIVACAHPY
jgi:hypothetical protein